MQHTIHMLHGDRSDERRAIKNVDNSCYENSGVACQETIVEIRSIAQVAPVSLLAIIPNHFPAAKKHVETWTLPDLVLLAHYLVRHVSRHMLTRCLLRAHEEAC